MKRPCRHASLIVILTAAGTMSLSACGKSKGPPPAPTTKATTAQADASEAPPDSGAEAPADTAESGDTVKAAADASGSTARKLIPATSKSPEALAELAKGETLYYEFRSAEALTQLKKVLELDPDLAQAQRLVGALTPGPEGLAMLEKAAAAAKSLPEAERLWIEMALAGRKGDMPRYRELLAALLKAAPDDWRAHFEQCIDRFSASDHEAAIQACSKAAELAPEVGPPHNILGYVHLDRGKADEATAAFKRYVEISADQPNAHDSLGDALFAAGRFDEAEASYKKALEVSPTFVMSWEGVAEVRAIQGDWDGAQKALDKLVADAPDAQTRLTYRRVAAWLLAARGELDQADAALQALEKEAEEQHNDWEVALTTNNRVTLLLYGGKLEEAEKAAAAALATAKAFGQETAASRYAMQHAHAMSAVVAARLGKAEEAKAHLSALDELVKADPEDRQAAQLAKRAHNLVLAAGPDPKAVLAELPECTFLDSLCMLDEVLIRERAGDQAGAEAAKKKLVESPRRDAIYVFARAVLKSIPEAVP